MGRDRNQVVITAYVLIHAHLIRQGWPCSERRCDTVRGEHRILCTALYCQCIRGRLRGRLGYGYGLRLKLGYGLRLKLWVWLRLWFGLGSGSCVGQ